MKILSTGIRLNFGNLFFLYVSYKVLHVVLEGGIFANKILYFRNGVMDGGVVPPPELLPYIREGNLRDLADDIHCDLTG